MGQRYLKNTFAYDTVTVRNKIKFSYEAFANTRYIEYSEHRI